MCRRRLDCPRSQLRRVDEFRAVVRRRQHRKCGAHQQCLEWQSGDSIDQSAGHDGSSCAAAPCFYAKSRHLPYSQQVSLSDATRDAVIYYTLDGTMPTISSTLYTTPIRVGWQSTIKAIAAISAGKSPVAAGAYTIER